MADNRFRVLRWKGPDTPSDVDSNDPDWFDDWAHPNTGRYTIGGTATNGDYVLTLTPVRSDWPGSTALPDRPVVTVTTTRSGGSPATNANIAAQVVSDINDAVAAAGVDGIAQYIRSASNPTGAEIYIHFKEPGHDFVVSTTAPSPGTWTHLDGSSQGSGTRFPCARTLPFTERKRTGPTGAVEVTVHPIDSSGAALDPGSCTYSIEILGVIDRKTDDGSDDWSYISLGELTGQSPGLVHSVAMDGASALGVRLHTIASEPGTTDRFEIRYRQVVT